MAQILIDSLKGWARAQIGAINRWNWPKNGFLGQSFFGGFIKESCGVSPNAIGPLALATPPSFSFSHQLRLLPHQMQRTEEVKCAEGDVIYGPD